MTVPNFKLTEPIVAALRERLQTKLNAEIEAVQAEVLDPLQHESLVVIGEGQVLDFVPPPSYLVTLPTIGIEDIRSRLEDDTGYSATGNHEVGIVIFCSNPDQRVLAWELRRYMQAIVRVCMAERKLGSEPTLAAWGVQLGGVDWGPTLAKNTEPTEWLSWAICRIICKREEL